MLLVSYFGYFPPTNSTCIPYNKHCCLIAALKSQLIQNNIDAQYDVIYTVVELKYSWANDRIFVLNNTT